MKHLVLSSRSRVAAIVGTALALGSVAPAFAVGPASPDLTSLTPDFTTVTAAIVAIAGAVAIVYVTFKGVKMGIRALRGL